MIEQERILAVAKLLDCFMWVQEDPELKEKWEEFPSKVLNSSSIAELCDLPLDIVNAALDNLTDAGQVEYR